MTAGCWWRFVKWVSNWHGMARAIGYILPPKLNSKLQNADPQEKAAAYRKTGLLIATEVAEMIESGGWKSKALEQREERLLEWIATEWAD